MYPEPFKCNSELDSKISIAILWKYAVQTRISFHLVHVDKNIKAIVTTRRKEHNIL